MSEPTYIERYNNGNVCYIEYRNKSCEYHREDGCARVWYYITGHIKVKEYYIKGKLHREDDPAITEYNEEGVIENVHYYINGTKLTKEEFLKQTVKKAKRHNNRKIKFSKIAPLIIPLVAKVFTMGHFKYDDSDRADKSNYMKGGSASTFADSSARHRSKHNLGQDLDSETKIYHLAHSISNDMMELFLLITGRLEDDRFKVDDSMIDYLFEFGGDQNDALDKIIDKRNNNND